MQITSQELTQLAYECAEIGVHARNSEELEEKIISYLEDFESDHREYREIWNDLLALGANIN